MSGKTEHPGKKIVIREEIDIAKAAFEAKEVSQSAGFTENVQSMVSIAVSELARNIFKFALRGEILIRLLEGETRKGVEIIAADNGPGIENIDLALENHFSTVNSLGVGLPGVKRIMDEFTIASIIGEGTKITVRKWRQNAPG